MAAAKLHYLSHDIAVPSGTFVIGRGSDSQLALDDPLVSRRHALLKLETEGATIEDAGSRNGVFLNGVRIDKAEKLQDGDLIRIGSQDISFYLDEQHPASSQRADFVTKQAMQLALPRPSAPASVSVAPVSVIPPARGSAPPSKSAPAPAPHSKSAPPSISATASLSIPSVAPDEDGPSAQTYVATSPMTAMASGGAMGGLAIIGSVADKALALGRAVEAERILQRALIDILARAPKGGVDIDAAERASIYALRLAVGTGRGSWIDYLFQLYTALGAVMPARIVDGLYAAVRKVKSTDKAVLRAYIARLRPLSANFGPADRFVLQRIESFERWAP